MSYIAWILLGLAAGFIGSKLVNKGGHGIIGDIIVGIVGANLGGYVFRYFGSTGITGFNFWSLLVAVAGSVLLLLLFYAVRRRI